MRRDLQMNQTPSLKKLCIYQRGLSRSWQALVSSSLSSPASSFFILLRGFFFSTNKIQSERILEANIRSFIWRLVKEEEDDEECVCVHKYVDAVALRWQLMQI